MLNERLGGIMYKACVLEWRGENWNWGWHWGVMSDSRMPNGW